MSVCTQVKQILRSGWENEIVCKGCFGFNGCGFIPVNTNNSGVKWEAAREYAGKSGKGLKKADCGRDLHTTGIIYRALCAVLERKQRECNEVQGVVMRTKRKHDSNSRCVLQDQSAIDYMRPHPLIPTCEQRRVQTVYQQAIL